MEINDIDFEQDQQEILDKSDIASLSNYCRELKAYEDEIAELEEKIKLIKDEFTIENGMLTPTLKLKRKKILEKYKEDLEKLY